uniref:MR_MLE domain-containing protein n=1 Tax=Macrostomum lignano TaxID=282301 RepID=A0A1I8GLQ4_9PLAT
MRISNVNIYRADLPLLDESYNWSDGKSVRVLDATVVELVTDSGIRGYGECCPLGPNYLPSYANGLRTGLAELRPTLIGLDPLDIEVVNRQMDYNLKGHPYVKSPVDMALWDILGKFTGLPVCTLLGGRFGDYVPLYRPISQGSPEEMVERVRHYRATRGYRRFQLKVGGSDEMLDAARIRAVRSALTDGELLVADANTGWLPHQAVRVCQSVSDLDVYIEQPCATMDQCRQVREASACGLPFILDESIDSLDSLLSMRGAADCINIKISKVGGLTKARQMRDLAVHLGLAMVLEDCWGSDFATAAIAHLAHSTPEKHRLMSADFNTYHPVRTGHLAKPLTNDRGGMVAPGDRASVWSRTLPL